MLPGVVPYVDGCVAINFAWKHFPSEEHYSTDGTPEFIRDQFKDKFFHLIKPIEWYDCIETYNLGHEYVESHFDTHHTWWMHWDCDWQLIPQEGYSQIHVADEWGKFRDGTLDRYRVLYGKMYGHGQIAGLNQMGFFVTHVKALDIRLPIIRCMIWTVGRSGISRTYTPLSC